MHEASITQLLDLLNIRFNFILFWHSKLNKSNKSLIDDKISILKNYYLDPITSCLLHKTNNTLFLDTQKMAQVIVNKIFAELMCKNMYLFEIYHLHCFKNMQIVYRVLICNKRNQMHLKLTNLIF